MRSAAGSCCGMTELQMLTTSKPLTALVNSHAKARLRAERWAKFGRHGQGPRGFFLSGQYLPGAKTALIGCLSSHL